MFLRNIQLLLIVLLVDKMAGELNINLADFKWLNEPKKWELKESEGAVELTTDAESDFWQKTWYDFHFNSGHLFYSPLIEGEFTLTACIEGNFTNLYDQAGLMVYIDEKNWFKAGIEYNDGMPAIATVLTKEVSDWTTGEFTGDSKKFWIRITRARDALVVKYSKDNVTYNLLRLCPFTQEPVRVGPMACTPKREGLTVKFSQFSLSRPEGEILH